MVTHPWIMASRKALGRSFPELAQDFAADDSYLCPQCLTVRRESEIVDGHSIVTREHVPPSSLGGKRLILTCHSCNSSGGYGLESDMRREANVWDFYRGSLADVEARILTSSSAMPVRLSCIDRKIVSRGVPHAAHPDSFTRIEDDFVRGSLGENWREFTIEIEFEAFSPDRAAAGWLRTAYLAFFATFGYRFILRPELNAVREKIRDPLGTALAAFRLRSPGFSAAPQLMCVTSPTRLRSYVLRYRNYWVFLPFYGDHGLYERLAAREPQASEVSSGFVHPWPINGPTFLHDYIDVAA
jgi:hypothetical protein